MQHWYTYQGRSQELETGVQNYWARGLGAKWVQGKALVGGPGGQSPTEALGF